MDHKKINLSPDDLKKLQALLKKEEDVVDAMTDEELDAAERALEQRIKGLPHFAGESSQKDAEMIDAGWQKLQKQLNPSPREDMSAQPAVSEADNVVPLRPRKAKPWAAIGAIAAAALALIVFYPAMTRNQDPMVGDPSQMQTKGVDAAGEPVYSAFCDLDYRGPAPDSLEEAGQGLGYDVDRLITFSVSVSCDQAGYIQVWSRTAPAFEVRDSQVDANVRTFIMEEGKTTEFSLAGKPEMILEIALTDKPITTAVNLFEVQQPVTKLGESEVLWTDILVFREKK